MFQNNQATITHNVMGSEDVRNRIAGPQGVRRVCEYKVDGAPR
jgi:hypothetical protein